MRLLNRLFPLSPIDNKVSAAVIDKLADRDLSMTVTEVLSMKRASGFSKASA